MNNNAKDSFIKVKINKTKQLIFFQNCYNSFPLIITYKLLIVLGYCPYSKHRKKITQ